MFKPVAYIMLAVLIAASVSGCNTMEGVGEDVEDIGQDIKRAS